MSQIAFLHPWLLLGLIGITLPLIIHLIGKKKAPILDFAAFDFLLSVNKRLARREKLRQFLLLLLRCLAILCLTFALARPVPQEALVHSGDSQQRLIIVLDTSPSMSYTHKGDSLLEQGKEQALELLSHLQPGDLVAFLESGRATEASLDSDFSQIKQQIRQAEIRQEGNLNSTIEQALYLLDETGKDAMIAVIGDLSKNSLELLPQISVKPAPKISLIDAANRNQLRALPNIALTGFTIEPSATSDLERKFLLEVQNYGSAAINQCKVTLFIDDELTQQSFVDLEGEQSTTLTFTHYFKNPGIFRGSLKLNESCDTGFPIDNELRFFVHIYKPLNVLAINGDQRNVPIEDELFFVEKAIAAIPIGDPAINLRVTDHEDHSLINHDLEKFDVVMIANVDSLPAPFIRKLEKYFQGGGGVFFSMGEKIQFETFNATFKNMLPHPIRDLYKIDASDHKEPLQIQGTADAHPIFAQMDDAAIISLKAAKTQGHFHTEIGSIQNIRALLSFDNEAPALIEGKHTHAGRTLLLTTSIDLDLSDLALRTVFPVLIQKCLRYLGKAMETSVPPQIRIDETVQMHLPTESSGIALVAPSGERLEKKFSSAAQEAVLISNLQEIGHYESEQYVGEWRKAANYNIAVNPSLSESNFNPINPNQILEELGTEQNTLGMELGAHDFKDKSPSSQRSWSSLLLLGLWLFLLAETVLAAKG